MPFILTDGKSVEGGAAHRRPPFFKTKKLGLLGATANLKHAPWFDPSWTLAAHPCCRPQCLREPDWYFDLHRPEMFRVKKKGWIKDYHGWLKTLQTPIFMQKNWSDVPMSVKYPLKRIQAEFRSYFTNQCAYMIALAMTEGVTHIGLFGCQYSHATEHGVQRDSLTYWLGRFEQAGGTIVLPPEDNTLLCSPPLLYGYESHDEMGQLVPQYRASVTVSKKAKNGDVDPRPLTTLDRAKVPALGNGEAPNWKVFDELFAVPV